MELIIERDAFIKSLSKIQGIVEKRNAMPILSNTLLKAEDSILQVVATDLEVTVMDKCPVDLQKQGAVTLNAKKLFDIVKELPEGPATLECNKNHQVTVKSGKILFELMGMSAEDYPKVPDPAEFEMVKAPAETFIEMIEKTIYAAAGEEARFSLHGIYTEKSEDGKSLRLVATDGHRLAMIERELSAAAELKIEKGVIMPKKGMAEAVKLLSEVEGEISLDIKEKMAAISVGDTILIMRMVDGKFPDYKRVIIEGCDKKAMIEKQELLRNLRRASTMVDEKARAVKFSFDKNLLTLESKNPNFGSSHSEMEIEYEGEAITIGFNDRYFVDIMQADGSEKIQIELKDEQSPAIVKVPGDDKYTCVVMPMRL